VREKTVSYTAPVLGLPPGPRYELLQRIGEGGAGSVYRAREIGHGFPREVCIKRLSVGAPELTRGLREEARLLARVRHANVVSLLGAGEEPDGSPYLVLELVRGCDLRALSQSSVLAGLAPRSAYLPDRVSVHVACCLLKALGAAQRILPGLVHRDVSPSNVLVSNEGEVKLADFGIALARDRARWTAPSLVKGKIGYMAPEHVRGRTLDIRADLFAVGVILYELLARRRPWRTRSELDVLRAIDSADLEPIAHVRPDLDRGLNTAVSRLLENDANDRYPCADDALRALAPYSAGDLGSLRLAALVRATFAGSMENEEVEERDDDARSTPKL
jgi:serine/threonine-protein kinase